MVTQAKHTAQRSTAPLKCRDSFMNAIHQEAAEEDNLLESFVVEIYGEQTDVFVAWYG